MPLMFSGGKGSSKLLDTGQSEDRLVTDERFPCFLAHHVPHLTILNMEHVSR